MTLKIEDLDEFERVTADMVRAWLRAKGWTVKRADRFREWWEKGAEGEEDGFWLPAEFGVEWLWIHALAAVHGLTVQSLLREINPRMRAGWPSEEEIERHEKRGGNWIMQDPEGGLHFGEFEADDDGVMRFWWDALLLEIHEARAGSCAFWPCDQHGNKTRRGV